MFSSSSSRKEGEKGYTRQDVLYHQVMAEEEEREAEESRAALDEIFDHVGDYGKYQKLLTWFVLLPACIPCGIQGFNQLFMANDLAHSCHLPDLLLAQTNFTLEELKRLVLPLDSRNETIPCFQKDLDWRSLLSLSSGGNLSIFPNEPLLPSSSAGLPFEDSGQDPKDYYEVMMDELGTRSWRLIPCSNGWDYDGTSSIVRDFDLVCGREIYPTIALFLVNLGGLVGVFLFGLLSDLIGRKASYFVCLAVQMVGGIFSAFASNFWMWTLFRVMVGLTVPAIYQIPFIICLELVGPSSRAFVTVMTSFFYVGGMMILPLIAFLEPNWRLLSLYTTAPFLTYFLYIWFLPESIRWLLAQERRSEALKILEHLARVNGRTVPPSVLDRIGLGESSGRSIRKKESGGGLLDLFRRPNMRLKTALLTLCWFCNCTVYVGLSYYGPSLGRNPHLSFFLSSAVELPGYLLCWVLMDRWGRRWPLCLFMLLGGALDIATILIPADSSSWLLLGLYLGSKLGISASYLIIYPFAAELFPTPVRGVGLGFCAYIGGIGLTVIPLLNYLGRSNLVLPLFVMGVLSVAGGCAGLRLPETLNAPLAQTIEEGEAFGKAFTWQDWLGCPDISPRMSSTHVTLEMKELGPDQKTKEASTFSLVPSNRKSNGDLRNFDQEQSAPLSVPSISEPESSLIGNQENEMRVAPTKRRPRLVRQGTSTFEGPTDASGAFIITPWW